MLASTAFDSLQTVAVSDGTPTVYGLELDVSGADKSLCRIETLEVVRGEAFTWVIDTNTFALASDDSSLLHTT